MRAEPTQLVIDLQVFLPSSINPTEPPDPKPCNFTRLLFRWTYEGGDARAV